MRVLLTRINSNAVLFFPIFCLGERIVYIEDLVEMRATFDKGIDVMFRSKPSTPANRLVDEQKAIAHLKNGNPEGLAVLVRAYQVEAVQAALFIVGDLDTAEEVVQEAFVRAYRKIDQFDDRRPFGPWFLRSVINAALKTAARQKRLEPLEDLSDDPVAEWLVDPNLLPQEIVETTELREAIWQALRQLTPDQRKAVVLRYLMGESEREMIAQLDRPLTTIKWWLHAARQRLRRTLSQLYASEEESQEVQRE